jgi:hypothetical protein
MARAATVILLTLLLLAAAGCDKASPPPAAPPVQAAARADAQTPPLKDPLLPESHTWTAAQAVERLDNDAQLSAAVRLVRLADVQPLVVPDPLPPALAVRLRVVRLSAGHWALGCEDADDAKRLRSPVFIDAAGEVTLAAGGLEEELAVLWLSDDGDVFPHLVAGPHWVALAKTPTQDALVLKSPLNVRFALAHKDGFPYVALVLPNGKETPEVARYRWDPYENTFMGPAIDKLPDPPGGKFELDLEQSSGLQPVGGEVPEPQENVPPPPQRPEEPPFDVT